MNIIKKIKDGLFTLTVRQSGNHTGVTGNRVRKDKVRNNFLRPLIGLMRSVTTDTLLEFDERFSVHPKTGDVQFKHKGETVNLNLIPYYRKPFRFYQYVINVVGIKKVTDNVSAYFNNYSYSNPFSYHQIEERVKNGKFLPRPIIQDEPLARATAVVGKHPYKVEYRDHFPKVEVRFSREVKTSANDLANIPQRQRIIGSSYGPKAIRRQMQKADFTMVLNVCSYGVSYDDKYRIESYSGGCDRNGHSADWGYKGKTTTLKPHLKRLVEVMETTIERAENNHYWTEKNLKEQNKNDAIFGSIYSDSGLKDEEDTVRDLVGLPKANGDYGSFGYIATKDGAKLCIANGSTIHGKSSIMNSANFIGFHISFSEATGFYSMDQTNNVPGFDKMTREDLIDVIKIMVKGITRNNEDRIKAFAKAVKQTDRLNEN